MTTPLIPKNKANFFAAVRSRGVLNTMLDGPARRFESANPGLKTRWELAPPSGDMTFVVAREAMGFRIVHYEELPDLTQTEQDKKGPVRVGDLILMAAPADLVAEILAEDARMAFEDWKLPEASYREHLKTLRVRLKGGDEDGPEPVGKVKVTSETVGVREPQHDVETEEGG